jgi:uncharacterized protein (TIGR00290 family)
MTKTPIIMCWSGGKDGALALAELLDSPNYEVRGLLTTVTEGYDRISMHGVRRELLEAQADSIGLPLTQVTIPPQCINDIYQQRMNDACRAFQKQGINHMAFGDLFLEDIRAYRDKVLGSIGMTAVYPVWGLDTKKLAHDFIDRGFKAILCCIDPKQIGQEFCGRDYDEAMLAALPISADPCGENGEFHTFVYDGPIFKKPIPCVKGEVVLRDNFWFSDIVLSDNEHRLTASRRH